MNNVLAIINETSDDWLRLFVELPPGPNQLIIDGEAAADAISGIFIDDIHLWTCTDFGE